MRCAIGSCGLIFRFRWGGRCERIHHVRGSNDGVPGNFRDFCVVYGESFRESVVPFRVSNLCQFLFQRGTGCRRILESDGVERCRFDLFRVAPQGGIGDDGNRLRMVRDVLPCFRRGESDARLRHFRKDGVGFAIVAYAHGALLTLAGEGCAECKAHCGVERCHAGREVLASGSLKVVFDSEAIAPHACNVTSVCSGVGNPCADGVREQRVGDVCGVTGGGCQRVHVEQCRTLVRGESGDGVERKRLHIVSFIYPVNRAVSLRIVGQATPYGVHADS